jgi:hypothetical protein
VAIHAVNLSKPAIDSARSNFSLVISATKTKLTAPGSLCGKNAAMSKRPRLVFCERIFVLVTLATFLQARRRRASLNRVEDIFERAGFKNPKGERPNRNK